MNTSFFIKAVITGNVYVTCNYYQKQPLILFKLIFIRLPHNSFIYLFHLSLFRPIVRSFVYYYINSFILLFVRSIDQSFVFNLNDNDV